jgi:chloramphenicol 3-O-phosphotransferase
VTVPTIFITGPVGVGKTIVASDVSWFAEAAGIPHAGLDVDGLTWVHPAPPPALAYENVSSVWEAYRRVGATHVILAQVLYSRSELEHFQAAIPGADITVFRLRAELKTLLDRIAKREGDGPGAAVHRRQAEELFHQMDAEGVEDHLIDTDSRPAHEVAREIFDLSGWKRASSRG